MLITPASELDRNPDRNGVAVFGRLKPGVSRASAEGDLRRLAHAIDQGRRYGIEVEPVNFDLQQEFTWLAGRNLRLTLLILFDAVSLVLLISCVNVANLLLSRSLVRRRELAIRAALGSSRTRLARQLLTESLLLCLLAAVVGIGIAAGAVHWFRVANPVELPPGATLSVNIPVLLFTLGLALVTTVLFGFVPAWHGSRIGVSEALKSGGRTSTGLSGQRFAKGLIAAEILFSVVLLAGAGLLIRSIANFASAPMGFIPERLLTMTVNLPIRSYPKAQQQMAFYDRVKSRVLALPGVEGMGISTHITLKGGTGVSAVSVEGRPPADPKKFILDTEQQSVTDGYFRFMGIPLQRGREFQGTDRGASGSRGRGERSNGAQIFPS